MHYIVIIRGDATPLSHDIKTTYFGSKNDIKFRGLIIIIVSFPFLPEICAGGVRVEVFQDSRLPAGGVRRRRDAPAARHVHALDCAGVRQHEPAPQRAAAQPRPRGGVE